MLPDIFVFSYFAKRNANFMEILNDYLRALQIGLPTNSSILIRFVASVLLLTLLNMVSDFEFDSPYDRFIPSAA